MTNLSGKKLKTYEIQNLIGSGGLGKVYKAKDLRNGHLVAIKFLHEKFQRSKKLLGLFHREMLIVSSLHHKHIVSYRDSHFDPPNCFIVTDFIDGWSSNSLLRTCHKFPPLVSLAIMIDLLQGIDYLHLHDVIHSDLSAANILVSREGRVYVADFGLSIRSEIEDYRNSIIGTPGYFSPEHLSKNPIDSYTDIYCAGLLLYEFVTGQKAIAPSNDPEGMLKEMKKFKISQSISTEKRIDKGIKQILLNALNFSASKRYANVDEMIYKIYQLGKKFGLTYPRHAILQFLTDKQLSPPPFRGQKQNIYRGI